MKLYRTTATTGQKQQKQQKFRGIRSTLIFVIALVAFWQCSLHSVILVNNDDGTGVSRGSSHSSSRTVDVTTRRKLSVKSNSNNDGFSGSNVAHHDMGSSVTIGSSGSSIGGVPTKALYRQGIRTKKEDNRNRGQRDSNYINHYDNGNMNNQMDDDEINNHNDIDKDDSSHNNSNEINDQNNHGEYDVKYHIVFSTGCTAYQDWQSYVMFYQAYQSQQKGNITRIVSGCTNADDENRLTRLHKQYIQTISPNFHLHFTPDYTYSVKPGQEYKFFNKGFGIRHWMENVLQYDSQQQQQQQQQLSNNRNKSSRSNNSNKNNNANNDNDDVVIIILDPDQVIIRPFTNNFTENVMWASSSSSPQQQRIVQHGMPFGQRYGFSTDLENWLPTIDMTKIAPTHELPSSVNNLTKEQAVEGYPVGPPYIATGKDMYKLVTKWTDFAPSVYDVKPGHITEMYAYVIGAAHLQLPHQLASSFMISNVQASHKRGEGWLLIDDQFSDTEVCSPDLLLSRDDDDDDSRRREDDAGTIQPILPHTIHYCQQYMLGQQWYFSKYNVPDDFMSCHSPLLKEPPSNISVLYDYGVDPNFGVRTHYKNPIIRKRHAFVLCQMIHIINKAAIYFKQHNCHQTDTTISTANYNRTLLLVHKNQKYF